MLNIDRESICRACLSTKPNEMHSFSTNNLTKLYESLTSLKIELDDLFPSVICTKCKQSLENFHDFKMICIRSYKKFESSLKIEELKIECNPICDANLQLKKENNISDRSLIICKTELLDNDSFKDINDQGDVKPIPIHQFSNSLSCVNSGENDYQQNSEKNRFHCDICSKCCTTQSKLKRHMISHSKKKFACQICCRNFNQIDTLKQHMTSHLEKESNTFCCKVCLCQFKRKNNLDQHLRTQHPAVKWKTIKYDCSKCSRRFEEYKKFRRHEASHEKPYECDVCGRRFAERSSVKKHMVTHSGEKSFHCTTCTKSFAFAITLKRHMLTHSGEKPYLCSICAMSFNQLSNLKLHLQRHSGARPFPCSQCSDRFSDASSLRSHMRTHNGLKEYLCPMCPQRFTHPSNLRRHKLTHSDMRPFSCDLCAKSFRQSAYLKRHRLTH